MKTKRDKVIDAIFLIALALVVSGLIISVLVSGNAAEATYKPTTEPTTAETTEYITEPTQEETEATEPPVTLYDVPLEKDLQIHIIETAESYGIDPAIIFAMAFCESTYRTDVVNEYGCYGLLQVKKSCHLDRMERLGCADLLDPYQNVTVAVDYLAEQIARYGDLAKGLTSYNKGHYAGTVTKYAKGIMTMAEEMAVMK